MATDVDRVNTGPRVVTATVVGTVIESYDLALFGLGAALVFGEQFFPETRPGTAMLASLATFAVGLLARPIGGIVMSHLGDRLGRVPVLVLTLLLMGTATVGIGLLPGYETIGVAAPILLVVLRVAQGFGAGAEYVGAILVAAESGPRERRGMRAGQPSIGYFAGIVLATVMFAGFATLPPDQFAAWGWRVPFLLSVLTLAVGLYTRTRISETEAFQASSERRVRLPLCDLIRRRPGRLLVAFAANGPFVAVYYLVSVYLLSYVSRTLGLPPAVGLTANVVAGTAAVLAVPLFGRLVDRVGRRPVWFFGCLFLMAFAGPMVLLLDTGRPVLIVAAATMAMAFGLVAMGVAQASLFIEMFETRHRFSGVVVARETSAALFGGPTPFVAAALVQAAGGASWPLAVLIVVLAAASLVAVLFAPETRAVDLAGQVVASRRPGSGTSSST
ncbi:MFS transporter [Nonomuraea sp. NPDC049152]|uniref:MFS transporter n=1 Tax=Nonomuraea sp. NPDC049152 TaxID=3154350 RepID=UPI0033FC24D0